MKFISCHIENFGKLSDVSFVFAQGTNSICEENGWGKSTFAAFLRAMFYGLEGKHKRALPENERKRYKPWQGGVFGGQLVFEIRGKQYQISRIFHDKEANDEFELRDAKTNLLSEDYSKKIGEEIFQIDRESFLRTVFIGQNACETSPTDDINAKIGNLADHTNDLNNFDAANARLTKIVNALSPSHAYGSLKKRREELARCERVHKEGEGLLESMELCQEKVRAQKEAYDALKAELLEAGKVQEELSRHQSTAAGEAEWARLKRAVAEKGQEWEELGRKFPGKIPGASQVREQIAQCGQLAQAYERISLYRMGEEKEREFAFLGECFADGVPDVAALEEKRKEAMELLRLGREYDRNQMSGAQKERLAVLAPRFFTAGEDASAYAADWAKRNHKKAVLPSNEAALAALCAASKAQNPDVQGGKKTKDMQKKQGRPAKGYVAFFVVGILLVAAGIAAGMYSLAAGLGLAVAGVGLVFVGVGKKARGAQGIPWDAEDEDGADNAWGTLQGAADGAGNAARDDLHKMYGMQGNAARALQGMPEYFRKNPEIVKLQRIIEEDIVFIERTDARTAAYLKAHGREFGTGNDQGVMLALQEIMLEHAEYQALKKKAQDAKADAKTGQIRRYQESIGAFLQRYGITASPEDYAEELYTLKERAAEYAALTEQWEKMENAKEDYERVRSRIAAFYKEYAFAPEPNISLQLNEIKDAVEEYEDAGKAYEYAKNALGRFEEENDISLFSSGNFAEENFYPENAGKNLPSLEGIHEKILTINEEMEQLRAARAQEENIQKELYAKYDAWEENRINLAQLKEIQAAEQKKYELVSQARAKLAAAKEAMTAKYAAPLLASFCKYYEMLAGENAEKFHVDANTQVTVEECGKQRETQTQSCGQRDLVGICLRVAFVEAMYPQEAPVLIMDDPFTNLDDEKIAAGKQFLSEVAKKYQIIYFTCSATRA